MLTPRVLFATITVDGSGLVMEIRFYRDPETGLPHIFNHDITEAEAEWILAHPAEDGASADWSRQALGQTADGRYLRVIYVPDEEGDGFLW